MDEDSDNYTDMVTSFYGQLDSSPEKVQFHLNKMKMQNLSLRQNCEIQIIQCFLDYREKFELKILHRVNKLIEEAKLHDFLDLVMIANILQAEIYQFSGNNEKTVEIAEEIFQKQEIIKNSPIVFNLYNLYLISLFHLGYYHRSIEIGENYFEILKNHPKRKRELAQCKNNIALNYELLGELFKAEKSYQDAFTISQEIQYYRGSSIALNNLGDIWFLFGRFTHARQAYEQGIEIALLHDDMQTYGLLAKSYANFFLERGNFSEAYEMIKAANEILFETEQFDQLVKGHYILAKIWIQAGDINKSLEIIKKGIELSELYQVINNNIDFLLLKAEILNKIDDQKEAYEILQQAVDIAIKRQSDLYYAKILITKAKLNFVKNQFQEVEFALKRALFYGQKFKHIDIQFNSYILLAQNYMIQHTITHDPAKIIQAITILTELRNFTTEKSLFPKYFSVQIILGLLHLTKHEIPQAQEIFLELESKLDESQLELERDLINSCLNITNGIRLEDSINFRSIQGTLFTMIQDQFNSTASSLSFKNFDDEDIESIGMVIFKVDEILGIKIVETFKMDEEDSLLHDDLVFCGSLYATALGQGTSYHLGLFGALPFGKGNLRAIIYTIFKNDESQKTKRSKHESYLLLTLIVPENILHLFYDRKKLVEVFEKYLKNISDVADISTQWLATLQEEILKNFCS